MRQMRDKDKTREQLIDELKELRHQSNKLAMETKQAEEMRRYVKNLIDSSLDMIISVDEDRKIVEFNKAAEETFGYSRDEVIGKHVDILYKDPSEGLRVHNRAKQMGKFAGEITNKRRNGEIFPCFISASVIHDTQDRIMGVMGISRDITERKRILDARQKAHDELETRVKERTAELTRAHEELKAEITERKQAEESLRESEEKFRLISEQSMVGIIIVQDHLFVYANQAASNIFGYPIEEMLNWPAREYAKAIHPDDMSFVMEQAGEEDVVASYSWRIITKTGQVKWVRTYSKSVSFKGKTADLVIIIDITRQKQTEEALRESEERFRELADLLPQIVFEIDLEGNVTFANRRAFSTTGYTQEDFDKGVNCLQIIAPEDRDRASKNVRRVLHGEELGGTEYTALRKDGSVYPVIIYSSPVIRDDKPIGLRGIIVDITERKRMEEELLRIEKLESIGVLAGGIAHDLNNFLTAIVGNISLAMMYENPPEKDRRLIEAEKACMQIRDLTQQLLTFSKGGAPILQTADIAGLLRDSATFALSGSNVRCEFSIWDDLWPVEIDEGQINQVINNLIINAQQAMPNGGTVNISAENMMIRADSGIPLEAGAYIRISIQDQGIGIPAEHIQKVFDPFFTTKQTGSGLGLATSYAIIEKHNGYITLESRIGVGTMFHIYLPASSGGVLIVEGKEERKPIIGEGRILVMDDEKHVRDTVAEMLSSIGYKAITAIDGAEAMELHKEARGSDNPFSAIILDLTVPGGMGGRETIQRLIEMDPEVKAIVSSGYSNDPIMSNFREYGFKGVIAKPYKARQLSEVLHRVITDTDN